MLRHGTANLWQTRGYPRNSIPKFLYSSTITAIHIWFALHVKKIDNRLFSEHVPDFLPVDIRLTCAGAAVRGNDKYFRVRLAVFDQLDPLLHEALLRTFARLPNHQVDGWGAEEQLMCG